MNPNGKLISLSFQPVKRFGSIRSPVSEFVAGDLFFCDNKVAEGRTLGENTDSMWAYELEAPSRAIPIKDERLCFGCQGLSKSHGIVM